MALSASTVLEVRNGGSDTNGGGFVTGASGTDWSQQNAAQYSVADGVTNGTTTITSATANFGADVVGNLVYVQGGTGAVVAGWYQIISRTNSTTIVVDRSTGLTAGTGVTLRIGGALATIGQVGAIATVAGMIAFIKYNVAAFVATTASLDVANGCVTGQTSVTYCGYDTTRTVTNTDANRPTFQVGAAVSGATLFSGTNNTPFVASLILDGNGQTTSRGNFHSGTVSRCKLINFTNGAFTQNTASGRLLFSEVVGCSTVTALNIFAAFYCAYHGNTVVPSTVTFSRGCVSYANTGATTDGYITGAGGAYWDGCVAYGNGRRGFNGNNTNSVLSNCIAEGNLAGHGFFQNTVQMILLNCASFTNSSGRSSGPVTPGIIDVNPITGSGSFFTNAAGGVFTLNNTAGAGALCRAAGFPALSADGLTASALDVGAAQHADPTQPAVGNVRSGISYNDGASTGTLTLPAVGVVISPNQFGAAGTEFTGTYAAAAVAKVRSGYQYGAGGTQFTGTDVSPVVGDVRLGTGYGAGGTEFVGTLSGGAADYPAVGNVRASVAYNFGALVGTLAVPNPSDVKAGTGYGALGVEFNGTFRGVVGYMPQLQVPTLPKEVARVRLYVFDFSLEPEVVAGETLVTPTVPAVTGLTISAPAIILADFDGVPANKGAAVTISGGAAGVVYLVECRCTTSGGATLVRRMNLSVE